MSYTPLNHAHIYIQHRASFRGNSMHAHSFLRGSHVNPGMLNDNERLLLEATTKIDGAYVVFSYDTPIAWYSIPGGWHVVTQKFSRTTSRHQSVVRRALSPALAA